MISAAQAETLRTEQGEGSARQRAEGARRRRSAARAAKQDSHQVRTISGVRDALTARTRLFKLELKRNGVAAAYIASFSVGSAVFAVAAWLILLATVIAGVISAGVHWGLAVTLALGLQLLAIFLLVRAMRALAKNLAFAATRGSWSHPSKDPNRHGPLS